jgi:hypothetical protein
VTVVGIGDAAGIGGIAVAVVRVAHHEAVVGVVVPHVRRPARASRSFPGDFPRLRINGDAAPKFVPDVNLMANRPACMLRTRQTPDAISLDAGPR